MKTPYPRLKKIIIFIAGPEKNNAFQITENGSFYTCIKEEKKHMRIW